MGDRQLDILATRPDWFILPRYLPMRLNGQDFIHFSWPRGFDYKRYTVVVEVLDTSSNNPHRGIGKLRKSVELPHIQYDWHARLGIIPDNEKLPAFESELVRGSTYIIPDVGNKSGNFEMERHGVHFPPGL